MSRLPNSCLDEATFGVFKNGIDLLSRDTWEPREKIVHACPALEVFEQRFHGNARTAKYPGSAHLARFTLDSRTLIPIKHIARIRGELRNGKIRPKRKR